MGATATSITPGNWSKLKPDAYKDKGLDNALKAVEAVQGKAVRLADEGMAALQARLDSLKPIAKALEAAIAAAGKAAADLNKMAKAEKDDQAKTQLSNGASFANEIGGQLAKALREIS